MMKCLSEFITQALVTNNRGIDCKAMVIKYEAMHPLQNHFVDALQNVINNRRVISGGGVSNLPSPSKLKKMRQTHQFR